MQACEEGFNSISGMKYYPGYELEFILSLYYKIGVILRDSNGIAQVKSVTGNKILRILKKSGIVILLTLIL